MSRTRKDMCWLTRSDVQSNYDHKGMEYIMCTTITAAVDRVLCDLAGWIFHTIRSTSTYS